MHPLVMNIMLVLSQSRMVGNYIKDVFQICGTIWRSTCGVFGRDRLKVTLIALRLFPFGYTSNHAQNTSSK